MVNRAAGRRRARRQRRTSSALEDAGAVVLPRRRPDRRPRAGSRSATTARPTSSPAGTSWSRSARRRRCRRSTGIDDVPIWTNREATLARELPKSLLVLGGGPTGCELAQVYARFGVPVTIVQSGDRADADRASAQLRGGRGSSSRRDGVDVRLGVRATARAGRRRAPTAPHVIDLDDGSTAEGHAILLAVGRAFPLDDLGLEHYGLDTSEPDARSRATAGCASPTGCGSSATRPGPSSTPTRPTTRASSRSGWRSATTVDARLPGPAAGDLHRSRGGVGRADPRPGEGRRASTRSSTSPTSRRRAGATRSRRRSAT